MLQGSKTMVDYPNELFTGYQLWQRGIRQAAIKPAEETATHETKLTE